MKKIAAALILLAAVGYAAYLLILPTYYIRYRLTLDVDVNGVTHTGSGVVEIAYQPLPDWFVEGSDGSHFAGRMHGYAITVNLGDKGPLFVVDAPPLLMGAHHVLFQKGTALNSLPFAVYGFPSTGRPSYMMEVVRQIQSKKGPVDVSFENLPMILRFRNIGDPDSNEELDPHDLAAVYGHGVVLKRAIFELTNDPITPMQKEWPKWLADYQDGVGFPLHAYKGSIFSFAHLPSDRIKGE